MSGCNCPLHSTSGQDAGVCAGASAAGRLSRLQIPRFTHDPRGEAGGPLSPKIVNHGSIPWVACFLRFLQEAGVKDEGYTKCGGIVESHPAQKARKDGAPFVNLFFSSSLTSHCMMNQSEIRRRVCKLSHCEKKCLQQAFCLRYGFTQGTICDRCGVVLPKRRSLSNGEV